MNPALYIGIGVLTSIFFTLIGWLYSPIYEWGTSSIDSGLMSDAVYYYLALLAWALTPIWLALALARSDTKNLARNSFLRANIIAFLFANMLIVSLEFIFWILNGAPFSDTLNNLYYRYFLAILFQHIFLLVIWISAASAHKISNEFINVANLGSARKANFNEKIVATSELILKNVNNASHKTVISKQIDLLLEEVRFLTNFTSQSEFSKAFGLLHSWSDIQIANFVNFSDGSESAEKQISEFQDQTKTLCKKLAQIRG
jgi:hypothetical protein